MPTSPRAKIRRGFTLIEMSVVVLIIALLAAAVAPNLVSLKTGRELRQFRSDLRQLAAQTRESAISTGKELDLSFGSNRFSVQPADTESTVVPRTLAVPDVVTTNRFELAGADSSEGEWTLRFYPDGTTDGGGVELREGQNAFALQIKKSGEVLVVDGNLPDTTAEKWQAGEHEQRL